MAIKFEKIQAGMVLWSRGTYRNGMNRPTKGEWAVHIESVDHAARTAVVAKGGKRETWPEYRLTRLYTKRMKTKEAL